jgi:hypothetical protein
MFEQRQVICAPESTELRTVHDRREIFSINLKQCTVAEASASSLSICQISSCFTLHVSMPPIISLRTHQRNSSHVEDLETLEKPPFLNGGKKSSKTC